MPVVFITPESMINVRGPWVLALEKAGFTIAHPKDPTFTRGLCGDAETIRVLESASAVIAGGEYFTENVINSLPNLRVIARSGVGYDRVNVEAATSRNVLLTITPTANHQGVAEQAFALIFGFAKNVVVNDARTRSGKWVIGVSSAIRGTTMGLFGLGRTGRSTGLLGKALGMNVIATESFPDLAFAKQHGIELVPFEELLSRSDYLSLHCPHNAQTNAMFNKDVFSKMKKGSVLINTARGKIVVEADLLDALKRGHLGGAGLDVFEVEPATADNPLFALDNVVVSPHIGGGDKLSQENMAIEAADNIINLFQGHWPAGAVVNDQLRHQWKW